MSESRYILPQGSCVVQGYDLFAHMLNTNPDMMKMARMVVYDEGLPVVPNPGILSPKEFADNFFRNGSPMNTWAIQIFGWL